MQIHTQEHYDLMAQFEREFKGRHDKESKDLWKSGNVYQDGELNKLFIAYRKGYAAAKAIYQSQAA